MRECRKTAGDKMTERTTKQRNGHRQKHGKKEYIEYEKGTKTEILEKLQGFKK
jgi:hypothetical protein